MTPSCRVAGLSSEEISWSTASAGPSPPSSSPSAPGPKEISTNDCVATAPTSGWANGTTAPTAGHAVKTPTPSSPVPASRATIEAVMRRKLAPQLGAVVELLDDHAARRGGFDTEVAE